MKQLFCGIGIVFVLYCIRSNHQAQAALVTKIATAKASCAKMCSPMPILTYEFDAAGQRSTCMCDNRKKENQNETIH